MINFYDFILNISNNVISVKKNFLILNFEDG